MREPTIHITKRQLMFILQNLLSTGDNTPIKWDFDAIANSICTMAKKYALSHRSMVSTNKQLQGKSDRIKLTSKSEAGLFAQLLLLARRKFKHRGIQIIKPGTPEWLSVKDICKLATEFCNEFSLPLKSGYLIYLEAGIPKMKHFSLSKFKTMHSSICDEYESRTLIENDPHPALTSNCHDYYMSLIADKTGLTVGYKKQPEKYKYFIEVVVQSKQLGLGWKDYIKAQFAALEWANAFPDPAQLVGTKALQRVEKWAFEKNIRLGDKVKTLDWSKIKNTK